MSILPFASQEVSIELCLTKLKKLEDAELTLKEEAAQKRKVILGSL
jgi:hypothetical protein